MDHAWGYGSEQRLREENQDSFGVFDFPEYTLAVVCDGMGGHVGGAQASSLAVRTIHDTLRELANLPLKEALEQALVRTNLVIYEAARKNHRLMGMGTTVVVAAVKAGKAYIAHVGDSRAYRIQGGQVQQLTRDHTMVNLFVDAELLTPEDAATHPEAHVLSRSLGVERQVDVEVGEPIDLERGDVLLLCSDGVHGVVTDWEFANVDWGAPHEGVRHVLDIVNAREGDDNATTVAVMMGTSFEDVPATPIPDPKRFEESALGANLTAVPVDDENTFDTTPSYRRTPDSGGASYVVYEEHPVVENPRTPTQTAEPPQATPQQAQQLPGPPAADTAAQPAQQVKIVPSKKSSSSKLIPILAGGAVILVGGLAAAVFLASGGPQAPAESPNDVASQIKVDGPVAAPEVAPSAVPEDGTLEEPVIPAQALFEPDLPTAPRRLSQRPTRYTQPPPGGQIQWNAVQSARNKECAKSLNQVQVGMATSIDYAGLYSQAWLCFADVHQRPLQQANVNNWEDFRYVIPHFEGTPEARAANVGENPALKNVPDWYRPAVDGIEFRLERYASSTHDDRMVDVLNDLFGEPTIADHMAKDLQMVALAAAGLARVEDPSDEVKAWWARRVYVATVALNGAVGRNIERHRNEIIPVIRELLKEATEPQQLADGKKSVVPKVVLQARDVALGKVPPPSTKVAVRPKYVPPKEPSLEDLTDDFGDVSIQQADRPN